MAIIGERPVSFSASPKGMQRAIRAEKRGIVIEKGGNREVSFGRTGEKRFSGWRPIGWLQPWIEVEQTLVSWRNGHEQCFETVGSRCWCQRSTKDIATQVRSGRERKGAPIGKSKRR